jgi:pyruvate dehydrogenase E2 component (dihydrolipoamide acetyltransferase)
MGDFCMPSLGADMDEGILVEWLVKEGDAVHRGDIVAVVETPKSAVEVETFEDGTVQQILVEEGQTVPVGQVLAVLGDGQVAPAPTPHRAVDGARVPAPSVATPPEPEPAPSPAPSPEPTPVPVRESVREPVRGRAPSPSPVLRHRAHELGVDISRVAGSGPGGAVTREDLERAGARTSARRRISPLARRLAAEHGIDPSTVSGTGLDGSVRADDVRAAVAARATQPVAEAATQHAPIQHAPTPDGVEGAVEVPAAASDGRARAADMRAAIAALMSRSNREIPHYYLSSTVDLHVALQWMRERNRELDVSDRLVPAALLFAAAARAATQVPELNGHWVDGGFTPADEVRLGFIVSLRAGGLLVPAIAEADRLSVVDLMARIRDLTRRARNGRLRGSELAEPSLTVSNLGEQGVESVQGVIYPPQVALVGFGTVVDRPWAVDGLLGVRPLVTVTLAGDHRATDGATGARFLKTVDTLLQKPEEL